MDEPQERPLVSYVLATYNRPDDLAEAVASITAQAYRPIEIVVVSNSTDETRDMFADGGRFDEEWIRYLEFDGRMGVPEARNVGYERASGEIVVTIDDDAVLRDPGATDEIVSRFREREELGVLAFQSRNYRTDEVIRMEIPDPVRLGADPAEEYETTFFIGVGNAMRREVFEAVGGYPSDFVYGFEEMDLSIRVLDAGYRIRYTPSVAVHHKKSPTARRSDREELERQIENRIKLAVRNLPWRYVAFTALVWSSYWFIRSGFSVASVRRVLARLYGQKRDLLAQRDVVDAETIDRLKSGMLFLWWFGPDPRRIVGAHGDPERLKW